MKLKEVLSHKTVRVNKCTGSCILFIKLNIQIIAIPIKEVA